MTAAWTPTNVAHTLNSAPVGMLMDSIVPIAIVQTAASPIVLATAFGSAFTTGLGFSRSIVVQNKFLYNAGKIASGNTPAIAIATINTTTGVTADSSLFGLGGTGSLTFVHGFAVHTAANFLYVATYTSTGVKLFTLAFNGTTGVLSITQTTTISLTGAGGAGTPVMSPDGAHLYFMTTNGNATQKIHSYSVNVATGILTEVGGSPFDTGFNAQPGTSGVTYENSNLLIHPNGNFLYFPASFSYNSTTFQIKVFALNSGTGVIGAQVAGSPFTFPIGSNPVECSNILQFDNNATPTTLFVTPIGNIDGGSHSGFGASSFHVNSGTGVLTHGSDFGAEVPRIASNGFVVSQTTNFCYLLGTFGNTQIIVAVFSFDTSTAVVTQQQSVTFNQDLTQTNPPGYSIFIDNQSRYVLLVPLDKGFRQIPYTLYFINSSSHLLENPNTDVFPLVQNPVYPVMGTTGNFFFTVGSSTAISSTFTPAVEVAQVQITPFFSGAYRYVAITGADNLQVYFETVDALFDTAHRQLVALPQKMETIGIFTVYTGRFRFPGSTQTAAAFTPTILIETEVPSNLLLVNMVVTPFNPTTQPATLPQMVQGYPVDNQTAVGGTILVEAAVQGTFNTEEFFFIALFIDPARTKDSLGHDPAYGNQFNGDNITCGTKQMLPSVTRQIVHGFDKAPSVIVTSPAMGDLNPLVNIPAQNPVLHFITNVTDTTFDLVSNSGAGGDFTFVSWQAWR